MAVAVQVVADGVELGQRGNLYEVVVVRIVIDALRPYVGGGEDGQAGDEARQNQQRGQAGQGFSGAVT